MKSNYNIEGIRLAAAAKIAALKIGNRYRFGKYSGRLARITQDSGTPGTAWVVLVSETVAHSFQWIAATSPDAAER